MALDKAKHGNILVQILKNVFTDSTISSFLGFKGGTAAVLFYGLDRFSVDLDFDLLNVEKEDYIFEHFKKILEEYGELKEAQKKRFNLCYVLSYAEKEEGAQNIKIDINRRQFGSSYEIKSFLGISMQVMVRSDMTAHKFCAAYERVGKTNRDLFDIHFFLKHNWPINTKIIEDRMKMTYKEFLKKLIKTMDEFDERDVLSGMGELLNEKQKAWAKEHLKEDILFLLKLRLKNFL